MILVDTYCQCFTGNHTNDDWCSYGSLNCTQTCHLAHCSLLPIHDLRHTAATLMLAAGVQLVDVSKLLGHSSPEITARIYAHSFATNRRRAIEAVTNLLQKEGQR